MVKSSQPLSRKQMLKSFAHMSYRHREQNCDFDYLDSLPDEELRFLYQFSREWYESEGEPGEVKDESNKRRYWQVHGKNQANDARLHADYLTPEKLAACFSPIVFS